MSIGDRSLRPQPGIRLAPGADRLEFHYTSLSMLAPERVRFRFKLEGYDRDWVDAGSRRVAYYTKLPPGGTGLKSSAPMTTGCGIRLPPPWRSSCARDFTKRRGSTGSAVSSRCCAESPVRNSTRAGFALPPGS